MDPAFLKFMLGFVLAVQCPSGQKCFTHQDLMNVRCEEKCLAIPERNYRTGYWIEKIRSCGCLDLYSWKDFDVVKLTPGLKSIGASPQTDDRVSNYYEDGTDW